MISKLILGTAGLSGSPYGLAKRAIAFDDAVAVIRHALDAGFQAIDTAPAYGHAEEAIGKALSGRKLKPTSAPRVFTKTSGDIDGAFQSISRIGPVFPSFLWHNWKGETMPAWVEGVTVYSHDIHKWKHRPPGVIQCDWNLFNQDADKSLPQFVARSVFLQGLLTGGGSLLSEDVERAAAVAKSLDTTLPAMALWAALANPKIVGVVVGCSSIDEVDDILRMLERPVWISSAIKLLHIGGPSTDPRTWAA